MLDRPPLTLPEAEAEALGTALKGAEVVLEYGAGGTTLMAAEMGKSVFTVESDRGWLAKLEAWTAAHPVRGRIVTHAVDIGRTGKWGRPIGTAAFRRWPAYAVSVWDRADFIAPDLVLIDGRFRVACLLTAAFRTARPVVALVDDYADRPAYHGIEELLRPAAMHGRMAEFRLKPMAVPADRLDWVIGWFLRPQ
jgi:hypothetical protein